MSTSSPSHQAFASWSRRVPGQRRLANRLRRSRRGFLESLEGRLLLNGDLPWPAAADRLDQVLESRWPVAVAVAGPLMEFGPAADVLGQRASTSSFQSEISGPPSGPQPRSALFIIDAGLEGHAQLAESVTSQTVAGWSVQTLVLDAGRDGVREITRALAGYTGLDAVHILSHGSVGSLTLGSTRLDAATLRDHAVELAAWGDSLAEDGDILLYGCNVAAGNEGRTSDISTCTEAPLSGALADILATTPGLPSLPESARFTRIGRCTFVCGWAVMSWVQRFWQRPVGLCGMRCGVLRLGGPATGTRAGARPGSAAHRRIDHVMCRTSS